MKTFKTTLLTIAALLCSISASAFSSFYVNDIPYKITSSDHLTVEVTYTSTIINNTDYHGKVEIPESVSYEDKTYSVTSIGNYAFYGSSRLTSITIPNSVTSIGDYAFAGCSGLTNVTIPNSVTSIGDDAFENCSGLTNITIPNSVTSIGVRAFYGCSNLTAVHITDLAAWCKIEFAVEPYSRPSSNPLSYAHNLYLNGEEIKDLIIPNSVTSIGDYAFFGCSGLTSVTIGNSVTSIGEKAFSDCSNLTSVIIGNSVTSIANQTFYSCSSLTSVTIGDSLISIGEYAFYGCSSLTAVHITDLAAWCKIEFAVEPYSRPYSNPLSYAHNLYLNGEEVKDLIIPNSVTSIGDYAFLGCSGLTSVTIGNSVTSIGEKAFSDCSNLTSVHITDLEAWCKIEFAYGSNPLSYANHLYLNGKEVKDLIIPNSITSIGSYVFSGCSSLTSVTIPSSVTSIGSGAFSDCSGLTSITIPSSVTSIGSGAFSDCSSLTAVHITDLEAWCKIEFAYYGSNPLSYANHLYLNGKEVKDLIIPNSITSIRSYVFSGCSSLTSVTIPNSVTSIGDNAFSGCSSLTSITIPNSVTSIGRSAFYGTSWIEQQPDGVIYVNNVLHEYKGEMPTNTSIVVRKGTVSISPHAFSDCSSLTSITIPNSVTSIGTWAFVGCYNLKDIINCSDLDLKKGDESHGLVAYYAENVITPDRQIGDYLFRIDDEGTQLFCYLGDDTNLILPGNYFYTIASETFAGLSNIKNVSIPNSVTGIGDEAFNGCVGLINVVLGDSVMSIGNSVFNGCSSLTNITISNSVTSVGDYAFNGCSSLTNITIPNSVTSIGNEVFKDCSNLTDIYLSEALTSIGDNLLVNCPALNSITLGATTPPTSGELGLITKQYFTVKLRVPEGSLAMYQYANEWKKFFDIEEYDPTGIEKTTIDAENESLPIYNLQGVKMTGSKEYLPAGIYIQGGKKILVR